MNPVAKTQAVCGLRSARIISEAAGVVKAEAQSLRIDSQQERHGASHLEEETAPGGSGVLLHQALKEKPSERRVLTFEIAGLEFLYGPAEAGAIAHASEI